MSYLEEFKRRQAEKAAKYAEAYGGSTPRFSERMGYVNPSHGVGKSDWATAMAMVMAAQFSAPRYVAGIDPITKGGGDVSFGELESKLNKTETKMKTKRFYHTFEFEGREVTLCLLVEEQPQSFMDRMSGRTATATIKVGYAVCVPDDEFDQDLAKRISSGRAESDKARLQELGMEAAVEFAFDLGILNASAKIFERKVKRGEVVIKGIRPIKKEQ